MDAVPDKSQKGRKWWRKRSNREMAGYMFTLVVDNLNCTLKFIMETDPLKGWNIFKISIWDKASLHPPPPGRLEYIDSAHIHIKVSQTAIMLKNSSLQLMFTCFILTHNYYISGTGKEVHCNANHQTLNSTQERHMNTSSWLLLYTDSKGQ